MKPNGITFIRDESYFTKSYNRDKRLTLKAKGLLGLVKDLPPTWDFSIKGIASISKETKDTIHAITKELRKFGYCRMEEVREAGKFSGYHWFFYETAQNPESLPHPKNKDTVAPHPKKPDTEKPDTVFYDKIDKELLKDGKSKGEGEKTAKKEQDNPLPESVLLWLNKMEIELPEAGARLISRKVKVIEAWEDVLDGWLASNWTRNNIDGQLDRYDKKVKKGDYDIAPANKVMENLDPEKQKEEDAFKRLMYGDTK